MGDESVLYRLRNLVNHNVISVYKTQFKIGRASTNDLSISTNRYISSSHCIFEYDNGHVYVRDTSSNGTLINRTQKISKTDPRVELHSGDIVHLVFRKDEPESSIIFQMELPPPIKSASSTDEQQLDADLSSFNADTQMASYPSIPAVSPDETQENADLSGLMDASMDVEMKPTTKEPKKEFAMEPGDDMEDVLTCACCQEIMSDPISLEPCLHAFCSDCYASWEVVQRTCPQCRVKVIGKKKNFVINGILDAFLKAYPHKRPEPKLRNSDHSNAKKTNAKNEVGPDGLYLNNTQHHHDDNDDDDEEMDDDEVDDDDDDDDEDNSDDDDNANYFAPVIAAPAVPQIRFACRQCPAQAGAAAAAAPVGFQCPAGQNHILCQCCIQPMPDRRDELGINQSCTICHQFFCNMYFQQCQRAGCLGCLNQLRDFNFSPRHLNNLVNENPVESQIVQNYLATRNLTMRDFFVECCQRLDRNEFTCTGIDRNAAVPSSKVVCYKCGLKMFKELAYQFRVDMKPADIAPVTLRNRDNCYYGKQCRTQYTKPAHAQKLNHACEQIRFG